MVFDRITILSPPPSHSWHLQDIDLVHGDLRLDVMSWNTTSASFTPWAIWDVLL
jgi:hypothetical protein